MHTDRYCLLPGDLRDPQAVLAQLQEAGFSPQAPTLVLAECVLVYMEPQHSRALVAALGALMPTAALVIYEQARFLVVLLMVHACPCGLMCQTALQIMLLNAGC